MKDYYALFKKLSKEKENVWIPQAILTENSNLFLTDLQELAKQKYIFEKIVKEGDKLKRYYKLAPLGFETLRQKKISNYTRIVVFATIVALGISIFSLYVSFNATYGPAKLRVENTVNGLNKYYVYNRESKEIGIEFLVKNVGFGSTAFSVQPQICCENCSFSISYDGNEFIGPLYRPIDITNIGSKSTRYVMVLIQNIEERELKNNITVLIRDLSKNEKHWQIFERMNQSVADAYLKLISN